MSALTASQQLALVIAPKPGAVLSFISAGHVFCSIVRCPQRRRKTYHRLMVGMSLLNMILSACFFWGTWAIPSGFPVLGAAGTDATCSAQGFIIQFSFAAFIYYCSLSLFALLAARADFDESRIVRYEPWFHGFSFAFPLATAVYAIRRHYFNPTYYSWCTATRYPPGCNKIDALTCVYGEDMQGYSIVLFSAVIFFYVFATAVMIAMCCVVRRKEKEAADLVGKNRYLERARRRRSSTTVRQVVLYLVAFYAVYFFSIVSNVTRWFTGKIYFPIIIVGIVFETLQGFFNMVVYVRTRLRTKRVLDELIGHGRVPPPGATVADIARSVQEKTTITLSERSQDIPQPELEFSIFDGTIDSSSPWAAYLDDDGGESDEEQECGVIKESEVALDTQGHSARQP